MKGKFGRMFFAVCVLCLVGWMAGGAAGAEGKKLIVGLGSDTLTLDPQMQEETITNTIARHFYDGLLNYDTEHRLIPALAESWELADDQVTWTFHLRQGVKFSDGSPFTAEDVAFSIERTRDKINKNLVTTIKEVVVVDDNTVKIVTNAPDAILLDSLARNKVLSKAYVTRVGDAETDQAPLGTGPYKLVEWIREDHITMVPNEHYWGPKPSITDVTFRPITNAATRTAALLTGEVDIIGDVPVQDFDRVSKTEGIEAVARPGDFLIFLHVDGDREVTPGIDLPKNPMTDIRVRQAISLAIDRELITRVALNGSGYPTGQMVTEGKRGYLADRSVPEYNPEKAQALLKEAGYEKGFKVKLDAPNGRYVNDAQVAQALASQLSKVGIEIDLNLLPKSVFFDYVRPGDKSSLVMTGWSEEVDAGTMGNVLFYTRGKGPKGGSNRGHYTNDEYDRLLDEADATADVALRATLADKAARVILDDVGLVPLYFERDLYGKKKNVKFTPRSDKYILATDMDIE
ncbi:MAG: ABC transporter substrate-binding protein [Synergistaceae bacterium]|nr:ABC transporter substrate-binding protein [Synergistaceae bacterium]